MNKTGCSGLVHWDDPGGWDGERGGRGIWMGNTCAAMADSSLSPRRVDAKPEQLLGTLSAEDQMNMQ